MPKIIRPTIQLRWFATVDQGKQLELITTIDEVEYILATILADDKDESLWFEVCVDDKIIQIPIEKVKEALDAAPSEVRSETWYEQNIYPNIIST